MSKRRRQIKKKKQTGEVEQHSLVRSAEAPGTEGEEPDTAQEETAAGLIGQEAGDVPGEPGQSAYDDHEIVASPHPSPKAPRARKKGAENVPTAAVPRPAANSWLGRNKENLLLGMLVLYVFLLGLGTVGELFEVEWILNLPLFK